MSILDFLIKIYVKINKKNLFNRKKKYPSRKKQDDFLAKWDESDDCFVNSYNKYRCIRFYHYNTFVILGYHVASLLLMLPMFVYLNRRRLPLADKDKSKLVIRKRPLTDIGDVFPEELKWRYRVFEFDVNINGIYLDKTANKIIFQAFKRHPFSYYYLFVLMERLAIQSTIIHCENPDVICNYVCEREFADPILTMYSSLFDIEYYGFMHGDYRYQIDHAFMQYTRYWVWDDHYVDMFRKLKCSQDMVVYRPGKYKPLDIIVKEEKDCRYYVTYYLSGETQKSLDVIKTVFDELSKAGKKCKIRPHPVNSNYSYINKIFKDYCIEDVKQYDLKQSIEDTYLVVALNSTVLSQAFHSGKIIVIDDICDREIYEDLLEKDYITFDKARYRLSEVLRLNGVIL